MLLQQNMFRLGVFAAKRLTPKVSVCSPIAQLFSRPLSTETSSKHKATDHIAEPRPLLTALGVDKRLVLFRLDTPNDQPTPGTLFTSAKDDEGKGVEAITLFSANGFWFGALTSGASDEVLSNKSLEFRRIGDLRIDLNANWGGKVVSALGQENNSIASKFGESCKHHDGKYVNNIVDPEQVQSELVNDDRVFRPQPRDRERQVIKRGWHTGNIIVDAMTPIGIGQSMLFVGPNNAGKQSLVLDVIKGICSQNPSSTTLPMHLVYAPSQQIETSHVVQALENTTLATIVSNTDITHDDQEVSSVLQNTVACRIAECARDVGHNSLVVLDTLDGMQEVWERSIQLATQYYLDAGKQLPASLQYASSDRSELRMYYSSLVQRAALLRAGGSMTMLVVKTSSGSSETQNSQWSTDEKEIGIELFIQEVRDGVRNINDVTRLERLAQRGVKVTASVLDKLKIERPVGWESAVSQTQSQGSNTDERHTEELKSLCDGHLYCGSSLEQLGINWQLDPRKSLTRIGVGNNRNHMKDTRPKPLQHVAAGLRLNLSMLIDEVEDAINGKSSHPHSDQLANESNLKMFKHALDQAPNTSLSLFEQVALLFPITCGRQNSADFVHSYTQILSTSPVSPQHPYLVAVSKLFGYDQVQLVNTTQQISREQLQALETAIITAAVDVSKSLEASTV